MNYNPDAVPSVERLVDPGASHELLASLDPGMAAAIEGWRSAVGRVTDAVRDYESIMPPPRKLGGRMGVELSDAIGRLKVAAADNVEDLDQATYALAALFNDRGQRLAMIHRCVALADARGREVVACCPAFRVKVAEAMRRVEGETLAKLAPLRADTIGRPAEARVFAEVRDEVDRLYLPLAKLHDWTRHPRGPASPKSSLPASLAGRLAELTGQEPPTRFGGTSPITTRRRVDQAPRIVV